MFGVGVITCYIRGFNSVHSVSRYTEAALPGSVMAVCRVNQGVRLAEECVAGRRVVVDAVLFAVWWSWRRNLNLTDTISTVETDALGSPVLPLSSLLFLFFWCFFYSKTRCNKLGYFFLAGALY